MHPDHKAYYHIASRRNLEKSIETISGIFEGIAIDQEITKGEAAFLRSWIDEHRQVANRHPFNEILPVIEQALDDNIITEEERGDILWLCKQLSTKDNLCTLTQGLQRLHGILGGVIADGEIRHEELTGLRAWMDDNAILRTCWPYDEIDSLITSIMADGKIEPAEHRLLLSFFAEFVILADDRTITSPPAKIDTTIAGVCACCPEISFSGKSFCFTGAFSRQTRKEVMAMAETMGAQVSNSVSRKTDYLVIGSDGNPCWAYACYGRKVEKAVELRKEGENLLLVHESDFLDAVQDYA